MGLTNLNYAIVPTAAPDLGGISSAAPTCGGCYVVADVAGIVFGSDIVTHTAATAIVSVVTGLNGSRLYTTTSIIENSAPFTFGPTGLIGSGFAATIINFGTEVTVGGATL